MRDVQLGFDSSIMEKYKEYTIHQITKVIEQKKDKWQDLKTIHNTNMSTYHLSKKSSPRDNAYHLSPPKFSRQLYVKFKYFQCLIFQEEEKKIIKKDWRLCSLFPDHFH